jgi:hypothetical protein
MEALEKMHYPYWWVLATQNGHKKISENFTMTPFHSHDLPLLYVKEYSPKLPIVLFFRALHFLIPLHSLPIKTIVNTRCYAAECQTNSFQKICKIYGIFEKSFQLNRWPSSTGRPVLGYTVPFSSWYVLLHSSLKSLASGT